MIMNRKILSAILLMSLILSASCGSAPTDGAVTSEEQLTESTETEETTEARIEPDLPDTKWEGYQFRVLTKGDTNVHWKSKDIAATEENTLFRCHHLFSGREKYPNARDAGSRVHAYRRMR